jgi:predicted nucleotidyltransferase
MNVSGFTEALVTAVSVRLPGGLVFRVASLPALALLKVWAWRDRRYTAPGKDAHDLWMVLRHYAEAGNEDRIYSSEADVLTTYGFDVEEAGAWLLGRDARDVLARGSEPQRLLGALDAILRPEVDPGGALRLVGGMPPGDRDRQLALLAAFHAGLFQEPRP